MAIPFASMLFYAIATLLLLCSAMVVTRKNPVASAVYLVVALFLVAALYALLGADFAAAIQVLVYAGAIMVLFIFVIMLLNVDPEDRGGGLSMGAPEIATLLICLLGFTGMAVAGLWSKSVEAVPGMFSLETIEQFGGNTLVLGWTFLINYLWAFEMSSFLILLAIVASIMIAKKPAVPGQVARKDF